MFELTAIEIQELPAALSISDDDLCATCTHLAYCPGDNSVCKLAINQSQWPAKFNDDNYSISCDSYNEEITKGSNIIDY